MIPMAAGTSDVRFLLDPLWEICYQLELDGRGKITSWGRYTGVSRDNLYAGADAPKNVCHFEFWQELQAGVLAVGQPRTRVYSSLFTTTHFKPLRYTELTKANRLTVEFRKGRAIAILPDGSVAHGSARGTGFLLASNMIPQLAIFVRLWRDSFGGYRGGFYSPNILDVIPYRLRRVGQRLISNFDETIHLGEDGWITEIRLKSGVVVSKAARHFPSWTIPSPELHDTKVVENPARARGDGEVKYLDVSIPAPTGKLGAAIALPRTGEPICTALFLGGSGTYDRHGRAGRVDLGYRELLDDLARQKIANISFDSRGAGNTPASQYALTPHFEQTVTDARAVLRYVFSRPELQGLPLFLIGHSQGGLVALELGAAESSLAGVILLATGARPINEILEYQVRNVADDERLPPAATAARVRDLRAFFRAVREDGERLREDLPAHLLPYRRLSAWYRDILSRDPLTLVSRLKCPILIVHGTKDAQVDVKDAFMLKDAASKTNPNVTLVTMPDLDHLFKRSTRLTTKNYRDRRRRVSREMIRHVEEWILSIAGRS